MILPAVQKVLKSPDGMEIFTEALGDRSDPHVILIHALSLSGVIFDEFCQRVDVLSSLYVVRADLREHGQSSKPLTPEGCLSHLYADDVKVVIEAYELLKPIYAGWRLGGMIASDICEHLGPDVISGIFYLPSLATVKDVPTGGIPQLVLDLFGRMKDPADIPQATVEFANSCFMSDVPKPVPYSLRCM